MKKCLFVGSFDPVTIAHQNIAYDLLKDKIVDYIYFLPVNSKDKNKVLDIKKRIDMLNLIKKEKIEVLNIYNYQENGWFNYYVLEKLKKEKKITYIIMGSDLFLKLKTFLNYEEILKKYKIILIKRNEIDILKEIKENFLKYQKSFLIASNIYDASSTKAKKDLKENKNNYLDEKVLDYIMKNNLYN